MLLVTLAAQSQPVFVDLRKVNGGRWELETAPDEEEDQEKTIEEGSEEEEATPKTIS